MKHTDNEHTEKKNVVMWTIVYIFSISKPLRFVGYSTILRNQSTL